MKSSKSRLNLKESQFNLSGLLNQYSFLSPHEYNEKVKLLSQIKNSVMLNKRYPQLTFPEIYEFTIDSLSYKIQKQQPFLLHVLALFFKFWMKKDDMNNLYQGILNLVQQKGTTLMVCLKYFHTVIQTMQQEIQKQQATLDRDVCRFERHFINRILNEFLKFANIFLSRAVSRDQLIVYDQFQKQVLQEPETLKSAQEREEKEEKHEDGLFTIHQSQEMLLQIFRLIHSCITFDFSDFLRTQQVEDNLYELNPITIPTKYSKYAQFREFDIFICNSGNIDLIGYLYYACKNNKLKIMMIRLLGDLSRIHFRFFKTKAYHKQYIQSITHVFINSISSISMCLPNLQLILAFGEFLRKLFKQPIFFYISIQFIQMIIQELQQFVSQAIPQLLPQLPLQGFISVCRCYFTCISQLANNIQFHYPDNENQNLFEMLDKMIEKVGKQFQKLVFMDSDKCIIFNKNYECALLQQNRIQQIRDICKIFRIFRPIMYVQAWNNDDRYLLSFIRKFQYAFYVSVGQCNQSLLTNSQINNEINRIKRSMKELSQLLGLVERQGQPEEDSLAQTCADKSHLINPNINRPKYNNNKIITIIQYLSQLIHNQLRVPIKHYLQLTDTRPAQWLQWCIIHRQYDTIQHITPILCQFTQQQALSIWDYIIQALPNIHKHNIIVDMCQVMDIVSQCHYQVYGEQKLKEIVMGNSYECNKHSNRWLILSCILQNINNKKGKYNSNANKIYNIIQKQYLHVHDHHHEYISSHLFPLNANILSTIKEILKKQEHADNNVKFTLFTKFRQLYYIKQHTRLKHYQHIIQIVHMILVTIYPNKNIYKVLINQQYSSLYYFTIAIINQNTSIHTITQLYSYVQLLQMCSSLYPQIFRDYNILYQITHILHHNNHIYVSYFKRVKLCLKLVNFLLQELDRDNDTVFQLVHKEISENDELKRKIIISIIEHVKIGLEDKDYEAVVQNIKNYHQIMSHMFLKYPNELNETVTQMYTYNLFVQVQEKGTQSTINKIIEEYESEIQYCDKKRSSSFFAEEQNPLREDYEFN